jgi:hypothetical protein
VEAASRFFRCAPLGYAATPSERVFDGVELTTDTWGITPLEVQQAESSYFDDPRRFPPGTAILDSGFLMAGLDTTWRHGQRFEPPRSTRRSHSTRSEAKKV